MERRPIIVRCVRSEVCSFINFLVENQKLETLIIQGEVRSIIFIYVNSRVEPVQRSITFLVPDVHMNTKMKKFNDQLSIIATTTFDDLQEDWTFQVLRVYNDGIQNNGSIRRVIDGDIVGLWTCTKRSKSSRLAASARVATRALRRIREEIQRHVRLNGNKSSDGRDPATRRIISVGRFNRCIVKWMTANRTIISICNGVEMQQWDEIDHESKKKNQRTSV